MESKNILNPKENVKELELIKVLKKGNVKEKDVRILVKNSILNLNLLDSNGYNCLHYAIKAENPDIVNLLLTEAESETSTAPADPNIETEDSKKEIYLSPLHLALQEVNDTNSQSKIVKILVKKNADLSKKDELGMNVLHKVAEKGNIDLLFYLLELKPEFLNSVCKYGSILHIAVSNDHVEMVESILESTEIDLSLEDYTKNTALLLGVVVKNFNAFKVILDHIKGSTTLDVEKKKALINHKNEDGNNLLHELAYARTSVILEMVKKLDKSYGIDPEEKNKQNHTYVDIQNDIVKMLAEKEENEKKRKEALKQEKIRLIEEKKRIEREMQEEEEKAILQEEKDREFREKIVNNRGYIICGAILMLLVVLYFAIQTAVNKKKQEIVL